MMLRIGNRNGFTLVEVMVATAILALGVVMIYQGFFISLDSLGYCLDYLRLSPLAEEKIWQAQDALSRLGPNSGLETSGSFIEGRRNFRWNLSYNSLDEPSGLYEINLSVIWQNGQRAARLSRGAYALYKYEE